MSRLQTRFDQLKEQNRAALVTFVTAGDPGYDTSLAILKGLPAAGADVIELGMPFTDPMADVPADQRPHIIRAFHAAAHQAHVLQRGVFGDAKEAHVMTLRAVYVQRVDRMTESIEFAAECAQFLFSYRHESAVPASACTGIDVCGGVRIRIRKIERHGVPMRLRM